VRILLDTTSEVGLRTARVLLAESDIDFVGVWRADVPKRRRSGPADHPEGYDAAVTDRTEHLDEFVARATVAGVPVVVWVDDPNVPPGRALIPIVIGANVGSALGSALSHHPVLRGVDETELTIAWTEPGRPLRRGTPAAFPEPVGMSWTRKRDRGRLVGYRDDDWGGVSVMSDDDDVRRVVGVADHAPHLEALVLGATTLLAAHGVYPAGVTTAASAGAALYERLVAMELDVAVWRSSS
jgi:hypothetical protein